MNNPKLIRITTVPISFKVLLNGQHRFMSNNGFEVVGISSNGQEIHDLEQDENIRILTVEMTRTISPFQDLKSVWKMYKIFKKEKPLIVHTHTPKAGIVGMLAAKLARVPIRLHTVAGLPLMEKKGLKRKVLDRVEKLTYACSSKVYPNSKGLYDFILENKYTSKTKLKVIGKGSSNGIDTSHFNPELISEQQRQDLKKLLGIKSEDFVFIFVGRLVGDKGINELIAAFLQICKSNSSQTCKLLLVGWLETELDSLSAETLKNIETNPNIISTGFQKDVRPFFAVSDALVFPSYREGFPNVVMQAGAMQLPSIVTNINGCNEIIIEDKNGIIIPTKNTEALKKAMERLMTDKNYCEKLKENARMMIVSRYEQSIIWNALLEEYNEIIKKKNV